MTQKGVISGHIQKTCLTNYCIPKGCLVHFRIQSWIILLDQTFKSRSSILLLFSLSNFILRFWSLLCYLINILVILFLSLCWNFWLIFPRLFLFINLSILIRYRLVLLNNWVYWRHKTWWPFRCSPRALFHLILPSSIPCESSSKSGNL